MKPLSDLTNRWPRLVSSVVFVSFELIPIGMNSMGRKRSLEVWILFSLLPFLSALFVGFFFGSKILTSEKVNTIIKACVYGLTVGFLSFVIYIPLLILGQKFFSRQGTINFFPTTIAALMLGGIIALPIISLFSAVAGLFLFRFKKKIV